MHEWSRSVFASWGGTPIVRPAVVNTTNNAMPIATDYATLNGMNPDGDRAWILIEVPEGGRLAEKDAAGMEDEGLP